MEEFLREVVRDAFLELFGELPPDEVVDYEIELLTSDINNGVLVL